MTAKEAGFDSPARPPARWTAADHVQRPFHFALVDEADSLLVDEARMPLVIAGQVDEPAADRRRSDWPAWSTSTGARPWTSTPTSTAATSTSPTRARRGSSRRWAAGACSRRRTYGLLAELRNALHAEHLLRRDVDYIVRDGRVELVDEFTGRVAEDRQWPDGLQAALEAKEGVGPAGATGASSAR